MHQSVSKKNIQYAPQTGPYKVFVKDKGIWQNYNTARLQISVGNSRHTGDKFFALTEWAAARFDKVVLIVSDTLQRHNIALEHNISLDQAHQASLFLGKKWLKENKAAIENLSVNQRQVTLWDDWLQHEDFVQSYAEVCRVYQIDPAVQSVINAKAASFCKRKEDGSLVMQGKDFDTSVSYLLEEIAAFAIMFRAQQAVDIYPGTWFKDVFDVIVQASEVSPLFSGFFNTACLSVDFVRNKAFQ